VFPQPVFDDRPRRRAADKDILLSVNTVAVMVRDEEIHRVCQSHVEDHRCCAVPFPFRAHVFFLQDEGEGQLIKECRKCCDIPSLVLARTAMKDARGQINDNRRSSASWADEGGVGNYKVPSAPLLIACENVAEGFAVARVDLRSTEICLS
jgi:hypothetical protein